MERGLSFFQSSLWHEKGKAKVTKTKKEVTLGECVFLSPKAFKSHSGPIDIEFQIGDQAIFLGRTVTIKRIMLDENQNVIYRIGYDGSIETSVQQELLEKKVVSRRAALVNTGDKNSSRDKSTKQEDFLPLPTFRNPKELVFENVLVGKSFQSEGEFLGLKKEIKVREIIEFLGLKKSSNDLENTESILKIHKFLVQNPQYDDAIVEDMNQDLRENSIEEDDIYGKTRITSLAFQHLLLTLGIGCRIVVSQNRKDGTLHNAILVQLSKKSFFFDVENERIFYAKNDAFPYTMAGLGIEEYSKDYDIFGILPQDESNELLPIPSNVSIKRISKSVLNGYDRQIHDLTYDKKEKRYQSY